MTIKNSYSSRERTIYISLTPCCSSSSNDDDDNLISLDFSPLLNGDQLHHCIFDDNIVQLKELLDTNRYNIDAMDIHGNTPLTLAVILHNVPCIDLLLEYGALITIPNNDGWHSLAEAISYGDRDIIYKLRRHFNLRASEELLSREEEIHDKINRIGDITIEIDWQLKSWMPLNRFLPNDKWLIRKQGTNVRIDMTLAKFEGLKWVRGDLSFIYKGNLIGKNKSYLLDHEYHVYKNANINLDEQGREEEIDYEINEYMSSPVKSVTSPGLIQFKRATNGIFRKTDKTETVHGYNNCRVFNVNNINMSFKKRMEHMLPDDIIKYEKNQAIMKTPDLFNKKIEEEAEVIDQEQKKNKVERKKIIPRESLPAPSKTYYNSDTYFAYEINKEGKKIPKYQNIQLARQYKLITEEKKYTAGVSMCDDFPLTTEEVVALLEMAAPHHQFVNKLRSFMMERLPNGFPVKLWFPVFPTVTATISFVNYSKEPVDPSLFKIPTNYECIGDL